MKRLLEILGLAHSEPKHSDTVIYKVFIVAIVHPAYNKLAVMRLESGVIMHAVNDGFDWLLVDSLTLEPSPSGMLRAVDVDHITFLLNLDEFLNNGMMSKAVLRECKGERMIVLDEGRA